MKSAGGCRRGAEGGGLFMLSSYGTGVVKSSALRTTYLHERREFEHFPRAHHCESDGAGPEPRRERAINLLAARRSPRHIFLRSGRRRFLEQRKEGAMREDASTVAIEGAGEVWGVGVMGGACEQAVGRRSFERSGSRQRRQSTGAVRRTATVGMVRFGCREERRSFICGRERGDTEGMIPFSPSTGSAAARTVLT